MEPYPRNNLRIYRDDPVPAPGTIDPEARALAAQELLRPLGPAKARPGHRDLEPYSRAWYEELEIKRYATHGGWLRRLLEFTRHQGETLFMLGAGVGTDALQYQRHGVDVTICAGPNDHPELVRRNFAQRGLSLPIVHFGADHALPFVRNSFDLAYINMLGNPELAGVDTIVEVYRVLKPGGKVFVLAPARYDVAFWQRVLLPVRPWNRHQGRLSNQAGESAMSIRRLFAPFDEARISKRHLRPSDLPYLWRFAPRSVLERLIGQVLILRAFKSVTAALDHGSLDVAA